VKKKSRQTENVIKKSDDLEEIYERTEFSRIKRFSQSLSFPFIRKTMRKFMAFLPILPTLEISTEKEIEFLWNKSQIKWSPIFMIFLLVELFVAMK
jgi:hypothetical protein